MWSETQVRIGELYMWKAEKGLKAQVGLGELYVRKAIGNRNRRYGSASCTCGKREETEIAGRDRRAVHAENGRKPKPQVVINK